ncbi:CRISP-associated protein Cas1 [Persephonella hydrogeniphila]|uniref:CRISPR-associated endonuclease Cas1 n=1 Tax=Persephonella hydrogeniphila TaxID=198703 RepID=A0A285NMI8_9AQUI|nr:type I-B CRISPR-associated endonuclease Cas1b [Persephonella hydrogeniphila]SNZ10689.1 CRISP-associated protein Cas1 [Persephonella hydrogeniphila]
MKKPIYIFNDGELKRKDNTLFFVKENEKKTIPVNAVSEIHVFGEIELNKRVLEFFTKNKIPIFFYNYYGYYIGSYYPREYLNSGLIVLRQAEFYLDEKERVYLAKSFVQGAISNMLKNFSYYKKSKEKYIKPYINEIEEKSKEIISRKNISSLMALEGEIRKIYYEAFNIILNIGDFHFDKRTKRPPENPLNALISFGNSLIYTTVLSQIYRTHLDPRIGYLHETNQRSFSLNLDLAEIFKPVIVDRIIFSLVNKKQIQLKHFDSDINYSYLNEKGKQIFIRAFEDRLSNTIKYKNYKISEKIRNCL